MPAPITSLWTVEQIALTAAIVVACAVLTIFLRRAPAGRATETKAQPDPHEGKTADHSAPAPRWATALVLIVMFAVAVFLVVRGGDPVGVRQDSWSDANIIVSGRNYAREGLFAHWGAAEHQVVTDRNPTDPFYLYTQYPVGSNLINGLWQMAGVTSVRAQRLLPAACSLLALWLWFGLYRRIAGATVAVIATIVMATSYGFLAYADNLHFHAYALCSSVAATRCYVRAMSPDERRRGRWFLLTGGLMFVTAWFTWEYHLWLILFIALYALLFPSPVRRARLALLVLPLLVALGLQAAQRRLSLSGSSIGTTAASLGEKGGILSDVYRRTIGFERALDTPPGMTLARYPGAVLLSFYKYYGLPALGALALLLLLLLTGRIARSRWRALPGGERLLIVLLVAGAGWWLVMLQHTSVHPHVMRQVLAGYALLVALVWTRSFAALRDVALPKIARVTALLLGLILLYPQIEGLVADLRVHFDAPFLDARGRADTSPLEREQMAPLAHIVPPGGVILTNHNRLPLMRLWSQRPVYVAVLFRMPGSDGAQGRVVFEMALNHLREVYQDRLPELYYVYCFTRPDLEATFKSDALLRFLLLGNFGAPPSDWSKAAELLARGWSRGSAPDAYCPIVGRTGPYLVFKLDRAVPVLRKAWDHDGFPTLAQFGPPR